MTCFHTGFFFNGSSSKNNEEVSLIRKADLENHNKDGGFWTVIDGKVYDIKDFQAQTLTGNSILGMMMCNMHWYSKVYHKETTLSSEVDLCSTAQFAGEDPVVALEAALQFEDTRESMQAFCVGQYIEVCPPFYTPVILDSLY